MKETRYFFVPDAATSTELPADEAVHAVRVLRLQAGDSIMLMDGNGSFYDAEVTLTTGHRCLYTIKECLSQQRPWRGSIHLAIAPTKMAERIEWLVEKAAEVGFDRLSLLDCQFSERRQMKVARLEKILVSAVKQSRKAWKPVISEMQPFSQFISQVPASSRRFIAHCYDEVPRVNLFDTLCHQVDTDDDVIVMIGPEGDFSINEVRQAVDIGFVSVDLGDSRLRTETAGLSAVMAIHFAKQIQKAI